jgi:uncharacterized membrane protein (DUF2068 family)
MNHSGSTSEPTPRVVPATAALRTVALFEAAKGALVLLAGGGVFALLHHDAQHAADRIVRQFHLNPASHHPRIFSIWPKKPRPLTYGCAAGALVYALVRFVEAYGSGANASGRNGLPLSAAASTCLLKCELFSGITWPRVTLFVVNFAIVAYLAWALARRRRVNGAGANQTAS